MPEYIYKMMGTNAKNLTDQSGNNQADISEFNYSST